MIPSKIFGKLSAFTLIFTVLACFAFSPEKPAMAYTLTFDVQSDGTFTVTNLGGNGQVPDHVTISAIAKGNTTTTCGGTTTSVTYVSNVDMYMLNQISGGVTFPCIGTKSYHQFSVTANGTQELSSGNSITVGANTYKIVMNQLACSAWTGCL